MEIYFCYSLIVIKTADEYLKLTHREDVEMKGSLRIYNFEKVFWRYICYNDSSKKNTWKH